MSDFSNLKYYSKQSKSENPLNVQADLVVYGGTSAGVVAAIQAAKMGLKAVVVEFGRNIGGVGASGLSRTDFGNKNAIGGLSRAFYREMGRFYKSEEEDGAVFYFEPSRAQQIYKEWVEESGIEIYYEQHLEKVEKNAGKIISITMENGNTFRAPMFIDATYEGDLMAKAGVSYHVGRESNRTYKETVNGIYFGSLHHTFKVWIDPFMIEGKPDSGLAPGMMDEAPGVQGEGDKSIQAYNFRICLTQDPKVKVPFPQPPGYDPDRFLLLERYLKAGVWDVMGLHRLMQNGKTDLNNFGAFSTDHIGGNFEWPDGDYETRERIFQDHVNYNLGMLYYLANDERVPQYVREEVSTWGLPGDEFVQTANWPHQLYVREARRMISDVVVNERHARHILHEEDPVGLASYQIDSHNCRRIVIDGRAVNEGDVQVAPAGPFPISYRSIIPKADECTNLVVPVCLSASHVAYGSIRMEPVFMVLGQSAATAAALALQSGTTLQELDYTKLRQRLLEDGQVLQWSK